jgi:short-subunit dehydrogenase
VAQSESIRDKVVMITGAARGIGLAIARHLHERGARVAVGDVDAAELSAVAERIGFASHLAVDVTDPDSFGAFFDAVEAELGPVDVMINNAGVISVGPAVDEPDANTRRVLAVNAYGVILGTKLATARMRERGRGHVINIASLGAVMPVPGIATYSATKHAVLGYTDAIRLENARSGIRFSVILPALTNTEMIAGVGRARGIRNIEPEAVAAAVARVIERPRPRVIVPRSFGVIALAGRRLLPQRTYEAVERALGAERAFQSDVDPRRRRGYTERTGLP